MTALYTKLVSFLALAFAVALSGVFIASRVLPSPLDPIVLAAYGIVASLAFALLVALGIVELFGRRLRGLSDAVRAVAEERFTAPPRVQGADPNGDDIDRLAAHIERMAERIAAQWVELDRAAARRTELLVNVSHDLRTPLASMQGYLELLLLRHGSLPPAEERAYLETAVRHCERLGRLVGDLFELTRLEAEEAQPQAEDFMLAELAQDVVQKFSLDARRREVGVAACCEGGAGAAIRVHGDIGMVERVLVNLLDNALQHTPAGGAVRVQIGRRAQRALVAVQDTGSGIAEADLPGLFDRYERADRSMAGGRGGLGLAIAQRIVRLHGGELSVQSTLGEGTCFSFDLTLAAAPAAAVPSAPRLTQGASG